MILQQPGKFSWEDAALGTRSIQTPDSIKDLLGDIGGSINVLGVALETATMTFPC